MTNSPKISTYLNLQYFVILIYIALITLLPSWHFMPKQIVWFQDGQRLLELLLLALILIRSIWNHGNKRNAILINKTLCYAFFLLLAFTVISISFALSPRHALIETSVFAGLSYLSLFVADLYQENKLIFIKCLIYAIWASILLYMTSFYMGYMTAMAFKTPLHWPYPFTGFSNIRSFNQYQLWTIGLISLPLLAFDLKSNKTRILLNLALALWWVLLFYSASRGVLLAWVTGVLITALLYKNLSWPLLKLQLAHFASGYLSYLMLFKAIPSIFQSVLITNTIARETTNDRLALWNLSTSLIKQFPIFGTGPMHFAWYSQTNAHPHNSILQLAAEWGLPATSIIIFFGAYGMHHWFKRFNMNSLSSLNPLEIHLPIILFFTITTNAIYSLMDGVIVMPISQVLMFTIVGLMVGQTVYGKTSISNGYARFKSTFSAIILLSLIWSTFPEISRGLTGDPRGFAIGYTALGPRFWAE